MYRIYIAALTLISISASAAEPYEARFVNQWVAHCKAPFGAVELGFRSASGDATNDDMAVSIKVGTGPSTPVPLKPALYLAGRLAASAQGQCDKVSAVALPTGSTLLLIQRDDRPSPDRVSAVLLSAKNGAVLDTVFDLGAQDGLAELSEQAGVVRIKLIRSWRELNSKTKEPSPITGWLELSDVGGKIKYAWK